MRKILLGVVAVVGFGVIVGLGWGGIGLSGQEKKPAEKVPAAEIEKLIQALAGPDETKRAATVDALVQIGEPATPELFKVAEQRKDQGLRQGAVYALGKIRQKAVKEKHGSLAKATEDFLLSALRDPSDELVNSAAAALMQPPAPRTVIPAFVAVLKDEDRGPVSRWNILPGLEKLGPDAAEAIPTLIDWLLSGRDKKGTIEHINGERGFLCTILAAIGPKDERVLAALRKTLKDRDEVKEVRSSAAIGIIQIGKGQETLPDLFALLDETANKKKDPRIPGLRTVVLGSIGKLALTKKDVEALLKIAADGGEDIGLVRPEAVKAIGNAAPVSEFAWPALVKMLQGRRTGELAFEIEIVKALGKFGPVAKDAAATLRKIAAKENYQPLTAEVEQTLKKIQRP